MTDGVAGGEQLVRTKLVPPTLPSAFVARARLHEALENAVAAQHRLALVSAPAGSGKSTLLAGWLAERQRRSAWLQVEASDSDPARFWSYLVGAIGLAAPVVEEAVRPLVASAAADGSALVAALANALTMESEPLVVIVDDYHLIEGESVHAEVERFVELCPPAVTVVIGTRRDPPFRLGRLRVRAQLTEVRADALRFATTEAGPLLGPDRGDIDDELLAGLVDQAEGWAAGLVLAGVSLGTGGDVASFVEEFQGTDRLIVDYLGDELLATLADDDRQRLLETSILERLTGPLVDAVCGRPGGAAWLRATATANQLVIGLDRTGTWYRLHHLLRDLLLLEAEDTLGERLATLHLAAADWHRLHGSAHDAAEHYLAGEDRQAAADVIAEHATALLNDGQLATVTSQLERLGELAEQHVGVVPVRGWLEFLSGRFNEAQRLLERVKELDPNWVAESWTVALSIMIPMASGDVGAALAAAEAAPEPVGATQAMTSGGVRVWAGRFTEARPLLALAEELALSESDDFVAAVTPIFVAIAEIETGNDSGAGRLSRHALERAERSSIGDMPQLALAHSVAARTTSDPAEAARFARRGIELARQAPEHIMLAYAIACAGDVLASQDDPEGQALLIEARSLVDRCPDPGIAGLYLARAETRHGAAVAAPRSPELVEELTDREYAVLRLLPSELSQRDIASELYVSLNTVKTHCRAIYRKLGVTDRKAAIQMARDLDLL